jgi:hypothetical protein
MSGKKGYARFEVAQKLEASKENFIIAVPC